MKDIFDRLGDTIRNLFDEDTSYQDRDFRHAWDELNDYLDESSDPFFDQSRSTSNRDRPTPPHKVGGLTKDYRNLELSPGADATQVRQAYRRLLVKYHPDRHASDPTKQKLATEITSRLNDSYKRIMAHIEVD
jgi:DnaJ-class molecular chaperone